MSLVGVDGASSAMVKKVPEIGYSNPAASPCSELLLYEVV